MTSKATLFDFDFISTNSLEEAGNIVCEFTANEAGCHTLITPNAFTLVQYNRPENKWLKDFYSKAAFIFPDGMPVVWLSRLLKKGKLKKRIPGSDLFPEIWKHINATKAPVVMILPNKELAAKFVDDYPLADCLVPGYFDAGDDEYINKFSTQIADAVIQNGARFVFLGLTFPKQEILGIRVSGILADRKYQQGVLILLLGASYEFYFGMKKRAPGFIQQSGFEWLYRFLREPGRLWKRYTIDNIRFLILALKEMSR